MLKHPYNPKGAQTHLPHLSASVRSAQKGIYFSISKRKKLVELEEERQIGGEQPI